MNKQHDADNNRQPGRQAQQDKFDNKHQLGEHEQQEKSDNNRHPGQQAQDDKSSRGFDSKSDRQHQEKEGKGKVATSPPAGAESDSKRL